MYKWIYKDSFLPLSVLANIGLVYNLIRNIGEYNIEEDLDSEIEEIIYEMANIADMRNCFIEHSITSEKLDKSW